MVRAWRDVLHVRMGPRRNLRDVVERDGVGDIVIDKRAERGSRCAAARWTYKSGICGLTDHPQLLHGEREQDLRIRIQGHRIVARARL